MFTLSLHGVKNFPIRKSPSDLDVNLDDGTTDEQYIAALCEALQQLDNGDPFDLAIYLAGADPYDGVGARRRGGGGGAGPSRVVPLLAGQARQGPVGAVDEYQAPSLHK